MQAVQYKSKLITSFISHTLISYIYICPFHDEISNHNFYLIQYLVAQLIAFQYNRIVKLPQYSIYSQQFLALANIKAFSCMSSQITAASDWPHIFCTLGVFVQHIYFANTHKQFSLKIFIDHDKICIHKCTKWLINNILQLRCTHRQLASNLVTYSWLVTKYIWQFKCSL